MSEIERAVGQLENMEVTVTASVGEYFWNDVIDGYSRARIYNSTLRLQFLGGSPQVFKPGMAFTSYVSTKLPFICKRIPCHRHLYRDSEN